VLDKAVQERTADRETTLDILQRATRDPTLKRDRERQLWPFLAARGASRHRRRVDKEHG